MENNENDFNDLRPEVHNLTLALRRGLGEVAQKIIDSGVKPTGYHLAFAIEAGLVEIAQNIINSGVKPDVPHLVYSLRGGLGQIAQNIIDSGIKPTGYHFELTLKSGLLEIAENIYLNNKEIRSNLNLSIPEVRNFVEHMKSKEQIDVLKARQFQDLLTPLNASVFNNIDNYFREKLTSNKTQVNRMQTP